MRKLSAAILLTLFFISPTASWQRPDTSQTTVQPPGDGLIVLGVSVTDRSIQAGHLVLGLDKSAFTVYDNDAPQEITFFAAGGVPLSVGIIYDVSASMKPQRSNAGKMHEGLRAGLAQLVRSGHPANEYFLIGFNQETELLSDWTGDGESLLSKIKGAKPKGLTAFYDACYAAVEKLKREARQRPVLLIVSGCFDSKSRRTFDELRRSLKESVVQVYVIGRLSDPLSEGGVYRPAYDYEVALNLASETGGKVFGGDKPPGVSDMAVYGNIFERIALELRHQYTIGYKPSNFAEDGKWHRIKVKVKAPRGSSGRTPSLDVLNREGYFATDRTLKRTKD